MLLFSQEKEATKPVSIKPMDGGNCRKKGRGGEGREGTEEYEAYRTLRNKYTLYRKCNNGKVGANTTEQGCNEKQK